MLKLVCILLVVVTTFHGFSQNPRMIKNVRVGPADSDPQNIVKAGTIVFFNADDIDPATDFELFRSDGTRAGTDKLDFHHGYNTTRAERLTVVALNKVMFFAEVGNDAHYVYVSDGSQPGTFILETIDFPCAGLPTFYGGFVYYFEHTFTNHLRLRRTNGTIGGTSLVTDLGVFPSDSDVYGITVINGILYFNVHTGGATANTGDELWRSDGTAGGTALVKDLGPPSASLRSDFMRLGSNFFFITNNTSDSLWRSDGTPGGTNRLRIIAAAGNVNNLPSFIEYGGLLYMSLNDNINGREIWVTDGTFAGTGLWADINTGPNSSNPMNFKNISGTVYFAATTAANGRELWRVGPTGLPSLQLDQDINPGAGDGDPENLSRVISPNDVTERLIFTANNGVNGVELFCAYPTDTSHTTYLLKDIFAGPNSSTPTGLTDFYPVFFAATDNTHGREIQRLDIFDAVWKGPDIGFSNDWSVANCWSGGSMPSLIRNVMIPAKVNGLGPASNMGSTNQSCNHLVINDGIMNIPLGRTLTVAGDISNHGNLNSPGTVIFTGGPASAIHSPGAIAAPMILSNKQMYLTSNVSTNRVDLTNGSNITLDTFDLNLGAGALNGDNSNFVITNDTGMVTRSVGGSITNTTFPVGINATSYNPVTVTRTTGGAAQFSVRVMEGVRTQGLTGTSTTYGMVNRTWVVTQTSGTTGEINLSMQWETGDEQPGFNRSTAAVANYRVCPPPPGCVDGLFEASIPGPASGSNPYSLSRSVNFDLSETPFIITNNPLLYGFTGTGDWTDASKWTNGMVPPTFITSSMEVTIDGDCTYNGNLTIATGGILKVLPGRTLKVNGNLWQQ